VGLEGFFDHSLSGAGLADEQGESVHLALGEDDVEGALLLGEQCGCCLIEGRFFDAEVCVDHSFI
jgi:hypothetical protein